MTQNIKPINQTALKSIEEHLLPEKTVSRLKRIKCISIKI
jgi:hypothetical protein